MDAIGSNLQPLLRVVLPSAAEYGAHGVEQHLDFNISRFVPYFLIIRQAVLRVCVAIGQDSCRTPLNVRTRSFGLMPTVRWRGSSRTISRFKASPVVNADLSDQCELDYDDGGAIYPARLRTGDRILQMIGSAAQDRKAIPQKPWGPNRENSPPETIVNSAVVPPIATVP